MSTKKSYTYLARNMYNFLMVIVVNKYDRGRIRSGNRTTTDLLPTLRAGGVADLVGVDVARQQVCVHAYHIYVYVKV